MATPARIKVKGKAGARCFIKSSLTTDSISMATNSQYSMEPYKEYSSTISYIRREWFHGAVDFRLSGQLQRWKVKNNAMSLKKHF